IGISTSSVKTNLFRARKKNSSYCTRRISMTKKGTSNENVKIDFVSNSAFQKSVKKAKRLQVLLYIFISFVTLIVLMVVTHFGIQYLINEKIEKERIVTSRVMTDNPIKGAAISVYHTRYRHNIFSSESETVLYKTIGDREIVWDIVLKKYPAIGAVEVLDRRSGMVDINRIDPEAQRVVHYNQFNNERIIDFYYPDVDYTFLPQELDIATSLDENMLIEVALSFHEPMAISDLGAVLGYENVDWLWENVKPDTQMQEMDTKQFDPDKVLHGEDAYGYKVSERFPYDKTTIENHLISGAVISGTPQELKRFQQLDMIRASVLGVTIDKY